MNQRKLCHCALVLSLCVLPNLAHGMGRKPELAPIPNVSGLESEHTLGPVTHTAARDQGDAGFCWAYTISGLIEGEAQKKGRGVTLSPEYLALSHIPYMIQSLYSTFEQVDDSGPILGFLLKSIIANLFDPEGSFSMTETLAELAEVGVMPESVFSYKFPFGKDAHGRNKEIHPTLREKLESFTKANLLNKDRLHYYENNPEALREDLNRAIGVNVPKPTETFVYNGRTYTPQTFMSEYVAFNPRDYQEVVVMNGSYNSAYPVQPVLGYTHEQALGIIREAVRDDVAVPIGYLVYEDQKRAEDTGVFTTENCIGGQCTHMLGGHAVLAVGLKDNARHPGDPVDALIIKNSWGDIGLGATGQQASSVDQKGFFLITSDYLEQAESQQNQNGWSFVVPKKYLK